MKKALLYKDNTKNVWKECKSHWYLTNLMENSSCKPIQTTMTTNPQLP